MLNIFKIFASENCVKKKANLADCLHPNASMGSWPPFTPISSHSMRAIISEVDTSTECQIYCSDFIERWILRPSWAISWCFEVEHNVECLISQDQFNDSQLAKWKGVFLTCPCHKIYRDEAVGLINSNYTSKIMIFANMWNLGQFR